MDLCDFDFGLVSRVSFVHTRFDVPNGSAALSLCCLVALRCCAIAKAVVYHWFRISGGGGGAPVFFCGAFGNRHAARSAL